MEHNHLTLFILRDNSLRQILIHQHITNTVIQINKISASVLVLTSNSLLQLIHKESMQMLSSVICAIYGL